MDDDFKTGYWLDDGNAVNIILGWVPDFVMVIVDKLNTPSMLYYQNEACASAAGVNMVEGWIMAAAQGTDNLEKSAAGSGILPFNTATPYVNVESPIPAAGKIARPIQIWAVGITPVARTGAVIGTMLWPTVRNGYVYECTNLTGIIAGAQPVWPTTPGGTVIDADTNTWTCREQELTIGGGKGFTVGAGIQHDGNYSVFMAWRADKTRYIGNADLGVLSIIRDVM